MFLTWYAVSSWRAFSGGALCILLAAVDMWDILILFPINAGIKILGALSFCFICHSVQTTILESWTHLLKRSPDRQMPRTVIISLVFLTSQKILVALISSPTFVYTWPSIIRDRGTKTGEELKSPKIPNRPHKVLNLINHSFWDNACFTWPNQSSNFTAASRPWIFSGFSIHFLCHRCSSKVCRVFHNRGKSLHVNITSSMQRTHFIDVRKENEERSQATILQHVVRLCK